MKNPATVAVAGFFILAKNRNFDRNPSRGCNFDLEGGAIFNLRGCIAFMLLDSKMQKVRNIIENV